MATVTGRQPRSPRAAATAEAGRAGRGPWRSQGPHPGWAAVLGRPVALGWALLPQLQETHAASCTRPAGTASFLCLRLRRLSSRACVPRGPSPTRPGQRRAPERRAPFLQSRSAQVTRGCWVAKSSCFDSFSSQFRSPEMTFWCSAVWSNGAIKNKLFPKCYQGDLKLKKPHAFKYPYKNRHFNIILPKRLLISRQVIGWRQCNPV